MKKKLDLIEKWMMKFPCYKYYKNFSNCIMHCISAKEMKEFIDKKRKGKW